jgi:hypothetical protein
MASSSPTRTCSLQTGRLPRAHDKEKVTLWLQFYTIHDTLYTLFKLKGQTLNKKHKR